MPSFAACLYGSALYTPGPGGVRSRPASTSPGVRAHLWVPEWCPNEKAGHYQLGPAS